MKALLEVLTGPDSQVIRMAETIVRHKHVFVTNGNLCVAGFYVEESEVLDIQDRLLKERGLSSFSLKEI